MEKTKSTGTIQTLSYLDEMGHLSSSYDCTIDDQTLLKSYQTMMRTRHVDERMITLQRQGTISFAMSSLGEEACAVGSAAALKMEDWMYPQYRESGIIFYRGFTVKQYVHHMFCDNLDLIKGRQMPNHFGSRALNVVPVSSPIGTKIPHAAGCAYAMKINQEKAVAICYFGEGATSEGDFHTGLNFAAVRKVPAIFFCRNNGYAISTPVLEQFASEGIAPKGIGYGIEAIRVDGNDFFAVYKAVHAAREACINGNGPILIEAMTYRRGAHSTSDDPSQYRLDEETEKWQGRDPILRMKRYLINRQLWSETEEKAFLDKITKEVDEAIIEAKATLKPPLHSLVEEVYFAVTPHLEEQYEELKDLFP